MLYPIVRRQNETLALGYVAARLIECVFIAVGIIFVLGTSPPPGRSRRGRPRRLARGAQGLDVPARPWPRRRLGNGLILGYLMYRSGLVPRGMAMLGLIGGPLISSRSLASCFDVGHRRHREGLATIPEFLWELSLGIYRTVKGFKRDAPILSQATR